VTGDAWLAPVSAPVRVFPNLRQTVLLLLLFLASTVVAGFAFMPLQHRMPKQAWFLLVVTVGEGVGVLCGLRLARWPLRRALGNLDFSRLTLRWLLVIAAGNLLLVGSLLYAVTRLHPPAEQEFLLELFQVRNASEFLLLFVTVTIVAPVIEELLIRGILLRGLTLSWGVRGGVLWSAFFFALIHLNPLQAAPAFVNGVVWALVLLRTGSLGATLFLHSLNNGVVFLLVQLALLAPESFSASAGPPSPAALQVAVPAAMGLLGLVLVRAALRALPRAPGRLAAYWGLPLKATAAGEKPQPAAS
jgi:membrane protease YdiL (CAAX protease family)